MKKNILKFTAIYLFLFAGGFFTAHAQVEWFPIGATWHYQHGTDGWITERLRTFTVEKDTVILGKNARVVRGENHTDIVYEANGRVYYYFQGKFRKIFDFNVDVDDIVEFEFKTVNANFDLDTTIVLPMRIERVSTRIIDGMRLREIFASYVYEGDSLFWRFQHRYIEKIGVEYSDIQVGIFPVMPGWFTYPEGATVLRCYRDSDIEYIANWWARRGLPCDYDLMSSIKQTETNQDIILYPNPVNDFLVIPCFGKQVFVEIFDLNGKRVFSSLFSGESQLDVSFLNAGIYVVNISGETYRIIKN